MIISRSYVVLKIKLKKIHSVVLGMCHVCICEKQEDPQRQNLGVERWKMVSKAGDMA